MAKIVLDNIIFSLQKVGGISVVWAKMIEGIVDKFKDLKFLEYNDAESNIQRKQMELDGDVVQEPGNLMFQRYLNPKLSDVQQPFIFHSSYYRTCTNANAINITTVHDFTYEKFVKGPKAWIHKWQKFEAIRNSDVIVCISENTKRDLLEYIPDAKDKIVVIYNGVSECYRPLGLVNSEYKNCVLFVGARGGYKNFDFVVKSIADTPYRLMVVGAPLTKREKRIISSIMPLTRIVERGRLSDEELNEAYNQVACLAYTSNYEGFGMPVLEAQRAGCPVIALACSSIPEIIGDTPLLLNGLDMDEFQEKLVEMEVQRENIIVKGIQNASRFSWTEMQNQYIRLYQQLMSDHQILTGGGKWLTINHLQLCDFKSERRAA